MFNAATGRVRLNWKVLTGLTGAVLLVMLIGYLGPQEPKALAAAPGAAPAGGGSARPATLDPQAAERLRASARASAAQAPGSRPSMIEERVHPSRPMVVAAPTSRPTPAVVVAPPPGPAPAPVAPPPVAPAAIPAARPRPVIPPNQDAGDIVNRDDPTLAPAPAAPAELAASDSTPPDPEQPAPEMPAPEASAEPEPAAETLAADVASQPVPGAEGANRGEYLTRTYNFNQKGADWKDVLEYFSRATKLPIMGDTQDLTGPVNDFYHPDPMSFREAFRFFNRLLATQAQQRIALLRKDHIQIIKVTGSTAWLRYLDLDRMYDSYDAFRAAELPEDEKCVVFYTPQQADGPSLVDMYRQFAPDYMLIQPVGDSNELMVAGQTVDVDRWLQLVQRPVVEDLRQTRRFVLKNSQASDLRNMLTTMFQTQGSSSPRPAPAGQPGTNSSVPRIASDKIDIYADDKNGALVVKATPRRLDEIAKLIEIIDIDTPDDASMQVYKLKHARAEELANTLRQVFSAAATPRPGGKQGSGWWRRSSTSSPIVVQVFPDNSTNSLLVVADKDAQQEAKGLIERFDVEDASGQMLRVPLQNARAEQVVQVLQQVFAAAMRPTPKGAPMTLAPDMANNAVVAAGDPQLLTKVQDAIKQLDISNNQAFEHVVQLEHARPSEVANALTAAFQPKPGQPAASARFLPIEAAGTIIVIAPPADWERIEPMVKLIDEQVKISSPQVKTYVLAHADANMLANILNAAAQGKAQRSPGAALTRAVGDPRTSTLFVQALPDNLKEIDALVKQLDVPSDQDSTVVISLENADAAQAAQSLQSMANKPSRPGAQPIQIAAEPMTNSVVVRNAGKEDLAQIKDVLTKMDTTIGTAVTQTFRPKYIDSADLANILNQQYVNVPGKQPGSTGVKVVAGPGAVSVDAPADTMAKIAKKITELDVGGPLTGPPLVIELKNTDPKELANILNMTYSRGPKGPVAQFGASGQNLVAQAPESVREDIIATVKTMDVPGGNMVLKTYPLKIADALQLEPILKNMLAASNRPGNPVPQVSSDGRTNSLIVTAQPTLQATAEQMIAQLDQQQADGSDGTRQVISLSASQAADVAKILQESLGAAPGKPGGGLTRIRISASQSGNALVLTGPKDDVAKAAAMVQDIEKSATEFGTMTRTYTLTSTNAVEAAKILEKIASAAGKDAVKIGSDERTNTIFATGPAARLAEIEKVIKTMDDPGLENDLRDIDIMTITVTKGDAYDIAYKAQKVLDAKYGKAAPTVDSDFTEPIITVMGTKDTFKKAEEVINDLIKTAPAEKRRIAVRTTKVPAELLLKALGEYASEYVSGTIRVEQAGGHSSLKPEDTIIKELGPQLKPAQPAMPQQIKATSGAPTSAAPASQPASSDSSKRGAGAPLGMGPIISALQGLALGQTAAPATAPAASVAATAAQPEDNVVIKIDPETQQLFVAGTSNQIDQIDDLLKMIEDAYKTEDEAFVIKVYQLQHLNATSAAQAVEQMFNDAPVAVPQPPQPQPGQPGQPPQPQPGQPGQPGQPAQLGQQGQQANQQRGDNGGGRQRGQQGRQQQQQVVAGGKQRIRAIADLRVNAVIVRCNPADVTKVVQFLATIDREPEITQVFRILQVKNLKASEVERIIKDVMRMGGTKGGNTPTPPTPAVPGQQAVAELRQQLITLEVGNGKEGGARASLSSADTVTVTSEDASNTLYVSGPEGFLNVIEKFVEEMEASAGDNTPRVFTLFRQRSGNVAKMLQGLFPQAGGQGGKGAGPVIVSDDTSNTLVVSASSADMTKIEAVINAMEGPNGANRTSKVVRVYRTNPEDIQKVIDQIQGIPSSSGGVSQNRPSYQPPQPASYTPPSQPQGQPGQGNRQWRGGGQGRRGGGAGGSAGTQAQPSSDAGDAGDLGDATGDAGPAMQAEPNKYGTARNEPVAYGGDRSFWAVPAIVSSLTLGQVTPAPAEPAPADEAAPATQPAPEFETPEGQAPGVQPPGAEPAPSPGAEPGQQAPAAGQPAPAEPPVGGAIPQGPQAQTTEPMILRYRTQAIPEQTQPVTTQPAPSLPLPTLTPEQIEQIRSGQIRVTQIGPNEVVIEGPEESLDAMEALIRRMEEGAPPPTIRIFPLKNAQATPLAQQLTAIFQQIQPAGRTPRPEEKVSVVADARSNSLIVAASPERLEEVRTLIENLDAKPVLPEIEYKVYPLKHIQAGDAATTLANLLTKLQQQRGVQGDQFTITPDARTNTLIVTAPKPDLAQIESLINTLDVPPAFATAEMMIYPLHNVLSKDLVTVLNDMISAQISRPGGAAGGGAAAGARGGAAAAGAETILRLKLRTADGRELPELDLEKPIKIISEPNTNSVVVSSTPDNLKAMNDVVKLLDTFPVAEGVRVWSFALQYADATELATSLTKTFQDGRGVGLRAAPQGAQVPVVPGVPPTPAGQAFMFNAVIMADPRTNTLLVAGRQQALDLAKDIVDKLDRPGQISKFPIHVVRLDNNDAAAVAPAIEKLFAQQQGGSKALADKVSIIPEPATNALLVAANNENFKIVQGLITELDTFPEVQNLVRTFTLQNADATQVADTLKNLFNQTIYRQGGPIGAAAEKAQKVTVQADPRTNSVVISAKKENWPLIEQLVKQMDSPAGPAMVGNFTVIPLQNTDAGKMAGTITDLIDQLNKARTTAGAKVTQPTPVVIADPRTNSLLVAGSPAAIEQVQTLVDRLDQQPTNMPTAIMRVYTLEQASPDKIEAVINDLFGRRAGAAGAAAPAAPGTGAAGRAATQMQVYADMGSNSLIVSASPEDHALVANLVRMLDVPDQTSAQVKLFPLQKAQAQAVVQLLQSLYTMRSTAGGAGAGAQNQAFGAGAGGGRTGSATGVTFTADDRSNSVVVRAAPSDMRNIDDLIRRLDTAEVQTEMGIRWVQLKRADATDMAQLLTNFLQAQGTSGTGGFGGGGGGGGFTGGGAGTQSRAMLLNFKQQNPKGEDVLRRLLRQDIRVTPDARTNTLIVMAPPDSVDVLVALIESLDNISPVNVEIEIFQLQNADATEMVDTLERLFGVGQGATGTTGTTGRGGTAQEQRNLMLAQQGFGGLPGGLPGGVAPGAALTPGAIPGLGAAGLGGTGLVGGLGAMQALGGAAGPTTAGGRPILSFTVDTRTNSVMAAGAPDYLALVRQLIEQLDSQEMANRTNLVYTVKYAPATQIATDLSSYFKEESSRLNEMREDIPAQRRLDQEVTVVNAKDTNKLIISVSPRYESQVMELIRQLDQQPPMVMIQVLMAEVTLDNNIEWGFEFAAQDLHFTKTGSGHNTVGGTILGAAGSGTGFSFALTGEDFSLLLRTLQTESRVNVLSRPQIMVLDNQEAKINVGEQVPYVANYTVTSTGQLQTVVQNQQVGIKLNVTPHITPDDFVRMDVTPEISALSASTVQISQGLNAPIITQRTASTTVSIKNGETVVIGGLIRNSHGLTNTKVPVLGDIPILGYLFKSQTMTESRDELLIVLTPRIMRTVEDTTNISIEQRDVGSLIPYRTKRSPLWQGLQVVTPSAPAVPGRTEEQQVAPTSQPAMYGPAPVLYGPRPPSALMDESPASPQRPESGALSVPAADDSRVPAEPVSYLEQRR